MAVSSATALGNTNGADTSPWIIALEDLDYYPIIDRRAENLGIADKVLNGFAEYSDNKITFVYLPITRFANWFDEEHIHARAPDNISWPNESSERLYYSRPFLSVCQPTIMLEKNRDLMPEKITRIGTLRGFTPSALWQRLMLQKDVELIEDESAMILTRMLASEMVDALIFDPSVIRFALNSSNLAHITLAQSSHLDVVKQGYRLSSPHPEIVKEFNQYLKDRRNMINTLIADSPLSNEGKCADMIRNSLY